MRSLEAPPLPVESTHWMPPYPPSWLERWQHRVERLSIPSGVVYIGFALLLIVVHTVSKWQAGTYPVGTLHSFHVVLCITAVYNFALIHYLDQVARRAFIAFRPALKGSATLLDTLAYQLTTLPPVHARIMTGLGLLYGVLVIYFARQGMAFPGADLTTSPRFAAFWIEVILALTIGVGITLFAYHTIHQLRMVNKIYTTCTHIDLFDLMPLYAFAQLAARTAVGFLALGYLWVAVIPGGLHDALTISTTLLIIFLAVASFVWPLLGVHQLLEEEKNHLKVLSSQQLKATLAELQKRIGNQRFEEVAVGLPAITALEKEQEILNQIPTWPWQPGTVRNLASTILGPVFLWIVTRLLERFVHF